MIYPFSSLVKHGLLTRRVLVFFNVIIFSSGWLPAAAQYSYGEDPYYQTTYQIELGGSLGVMNALTDLGGNKGVGGRFLKDLNVRNSKLATSVFIAGYYREFIGLRFEGTFGGVRGADNLLGSSDYYSFDRYKRNLSFRSDIGEISLLAEVHPRFAKKYLPGEKIPRISPYLAGGIGFFTFSPQAKLDGKWINLKSLSTEGQGFSEYPDRKPYKLQQFNFPVAIGVKYKVYPLVNFSLEVMYRFLTTDYLDDVSTTYIDREVFTKHFSGDQLQRALALFERKHEIDPSYTSTPGEQRGNPAKNDAYFTLNFKLGIVF